MKKFNKLTAFLLIVVMLACSVPFSVLKANAQEPDQVKNLTVAATTSSSVTLQWSNLPSVAGYIVYSYDTSSKKYSKIATTTKTQYKIKKLKEGKTYRFSVRAYINDGGNDSLGTMSSIVKAKTPVKSLTKVKNFAVSSATTTSIKLKWSKVPSAQKYVIYRYNKKEGKYVKLGSTSSLSYKVTELKSGTSYTFAVKAYKKVNGKSYYSPLSKLTAKTVVKLTNKLALSQFKKAYKNANLYVDGRASDNNDYCERVNEYGNIYRLFAVKGVNSKAQLKKILRKNFSEKTIKKIIEENDYFEKDGKLYFLPFCEYVGYESVIYLQKTQVKVKSISGNKAVITVTEYGRDMFKGDYSTKTDLHMAYQNGNWVFTDVSYWTHHGYEYI